MTDYVYLSGEARQLLVDRGVKGVGIDAVSLGGYNDPAKAGPPHKALLGTGKFIVEELYFPDEVMDGRKRLFVAAPVKLQGAAAPGRARCCGSSSKGGGEADSLNQVPAKKIRVPVSSAGRAIDC